MLQAIENLYLNILRIVIIIFAGALLAATVFLGISAAQDLRPATEAKAQPVKVQPSVVRDKLIRHQSIMSVVRQDGGAAPKTSSTVRPEYVRANNVLNAFFVKEFHSEKNALNTAEYFTKTEPDGLTDEEAQAYASGLEANITTLVSDPEFVNYVMENSGDGKFLVNITLAYMEAFNANKERADSNIKKKADKVAKENASGMEKLYIAAASFGAFLLIVFLTTIIRIERNLRPQPKPNA